jgi:hypothetical protein
VCRGLVRRLVLFALLVSGGVAGCATRDAVVEMQPVSDNLASYWTCAVAFASDGRGADANEAFTFVPWFEGRVREKGVFEPLGRDEGNESEVTLRVSASQQGDARVSLRVRVIDTKSREVMGELEAASIVDENADAGDAAESKRILALRSAADRIIDALKEKRRISMGRAKRPARPAAPPLPDGPPVAGSATCSTQCHPPAASTSSHDEQYRVAAGMNATMKELRQCLDRVGAQLVDPAVLLRFSPDGSLRHMRVDVGGYEQLECIQNIRTRPPRSVFTTRASLLRCEYRCTVS